MGGEDINYKLYKNDKIFGVFRHVILDKEVVIDTPFNRIEKQKRIDKETFSYEKGGIANLTPKLLYSFENGVVCEYIEGKRLDQIIKNDTSKIWEILSELVQRYAKLHALGITHLDATLKNSIIDDRDNKIKIYDFEYYAKEGLNFELQCAYDYIRIIEHTLRYLSEVDNTQVLEFISLLKEIVPQEVKKVDFFLIRGYLKRINKIDIFSILKKEVFYNL